MEERNGGFFAKNGFSIAALAIAVPALVISLLTGMAPQNTAGPAGLAGITGDAGPQGEAGSQGPQGAQGLPGIAGKPGDDGAQGERGQQGLQGLQGLQGSKGDRGGKGAQGQPGAQGLAGNQGAAGRDGEPGANGIPGEAGANGKNAMLDITPIADGSECQYGGTKINFGNDIDNNGSLDASEVLGTEFVCNGAPGDQGIQGEQGPQGEQGVAGIAGEPGLQGPQGVQGVSRFQPSMQLEGGVTLSCELNFEGVAPYATRCLNPRIDGYIVTPYFPTADTLCFQATGGSQRERIYRQLGVPATVISYTNEGWKTSFAPRDELQIISIDCG